ncbi:MAG: hypothetical protein CL607_28285 [Anaerolineaceae bacterium]|nr:hypothetical protein [Anaerolineaceae bacterium]
MLTKNPANWLDFAYHISVHLLQTTICLLTMQTNTPKRSRIFHHWLGVMPYVDVKIGPYA